MVGTRIGHWISRHSVSDALRPKNNRYLRGFVADTSVASPVLVPLMPTHVPIIFYALIANAFVGAVLLGGVVSAGLIGVALTATVGFVAARRDFPHEAKTPWRTVAGIFARAIPLLLPVILLGLTYSGVMTPIEVAAPVAAYALALAFLIYRTMTPCSRFRSSSRR